MSSKCYYCKKTVYHAEEQKHDGNIFHAQCFGRYKKEMTAAELAGRNATYEKPADVQPAYYRVADPQSGATAKMETGSVYKAASGGTPSSSAPGNAPKFCPECGAKNEGAKFCGECGHRF
eukprot:TRINITY_DN3630_c0_g1_i6.p1 TRINITY_DN3630_c0_g1~~TRINITY_DN3630_c0_g1_i6.p1  ORF type:complete len:120 (-),score=16.92 TRINITY_DN3630_c0_g1_i6:49-408(-)